MNFNLDLMLTYHEKVRAAINRVIDRRQFILGEEGRKFEEEFAEKVHQRYAVGVGNGTDAIRIALLALGIKPGDEVISPAFNVAYTALAVHAIGAINRFVDCDPATLLMDLRQIDDAVTEKTRAIVPVHLYGQMLDMKHLALIAEKHKLSIVEDAAQAHFSMYDYYYPGRYSHAVAYSFYPTKNLGALGEAGAITTNIPAVAERARLLRDGGRTDRYLHVMPGINSCLDELQAAVLRVKLEQVQKGNVRREWAARYYNAGLSDLWAVKPVYGKSLAYHTYHLYVVRVIKDRDKLHEYLKQQGIPTLVHYPVPVPYQPCFIEPTDKHWPNAEEASREVLSLPMHPDITKEEQDAVIKAIHQFYT